MPTKGRGGCRRLFLRAVAVVAVFFVVAALMAAGLWWYFHPACERTDGIVYANPRGRELTFDVVTPPRPNGAAVLLMVSGRWKSRRDSFDLWMAAPLLRRGYTVFAVSHESQPTVSIQETVADVHRAVRFIRHHATDYGIDPERIGVTGGSSGGHLCLMLATTGGPGPPDAGEPVDRVSSAIQAAAVFFPVTNLYDLGSSTENAGDGGPPKSFREAFGTEGKDPARWPVLAKELSPVFLAHSAQAPVYIVHGGADTLTPLEQSEWFRDASIRAGAGNVRLEVREGKRHGWLTMVFDIIRFADWFDLHLSDEDELLQRDPDGPTG